MRKLNSTYIFLVVISSFTTVCNAQYKLNIGNFWVYSGENQEWKISIIDTAVLFDSVSYYETYEQKEWLPKSNYAVRDNGDTNQYFIRLRKDDLFEEIVVYNAIENTVIQPYIYKYNAQLGDKWIYRIGIDNIDSTDVDTLWAEVVDVFEGYQFGEWRIIKKITYWTGLTDPTKYFCDDFGELSEENYLGMVSSLKGCFIDGIAYGDTTFITVDVKYTKTEIDNYNLEQNYPNPFNPSTIITYQIPNDGFVNLVVYNTLGQVVSTLVDKHQTSGKYSVQFNANNLPSGVYLYKIESGNFSKVNKILLLR